MSSEKADTLTATDLLPRSKAEGRLLRGSRPGATGDGINEAGLLVQLVDISQIPFRADPQPQNARRRAFAKARG